MAWGVEGVRAPRVALKATLLTVGTLGFVVCLTMLFEAMRSVMEIGGSCASGGPYEITRPCPTGVAWIMPASIFGGLAFLAVGACGVFRQGGPRPYLFAWSALFLSLGWNFFEYGFDAPGGGAATGWIVCGVVFALMGGLPLFFLLSPSGARFALWGPASDDGGPVTTSSRVRRAIPLGPLPTRKPSATPTAQSTTAWPSTATILSPPFTTPAPTEPEPVASSGATEPSVDLVERLARLADLHDRGALDDDEYERAKDAVLGERGSAR